MSPGKLLGPESFVCLTDEVIKLYWSHVDQHNTSFRVGLYTDKTLARSILSHRFDLPFPHQGMRPYARLLVHALEERRY